MTTTVKTAVAPFGAITAHRIITAFMNAIEAVRNWNEKRRTVVALRALSADQLEDIGLTRSDVENFGR
jgi:uncharacterized protein YjiS (DUF1127 family)